MLKDTINKFFKLDTLISNLTGFVETKIELLKVELKENLAEGLSKAIYYLIITFVFALVILFVSLAVAVELAAHWGGLAGYGIVAGFYLIIGGILLSQREPINKKFEKQLLKVLKKKK